MRILNYHRNAIIHFLTPIVFSQWEISIIESKALYPYFLQSWFGFLPMCVRVHHHHYALLYLACFYLLFFGVVLASFLFPSLKRKRKRKSVNDWVVVTRSQLEKKRASKDSFDWGLHWFNLNFPKRICDDSIMIGLMFRSGF